MIGAEKLCELRAAMAALKQPPRLFLILSDPEAPHIADERMRVRAVFRGHDRCLAAALVAAYSAAPDLLAILAAANRACDALEDAHSTGRDFCAQMVALRDALVAAGMREAAR